MQTPQIRNDFIAAGTLRRSGIPNFGIKFIVAHDTGNPNSTAKQNVSYFKNSANTESASAHFFVDDKEIVCCVPEDEKAWHVRNITTVDNALFGCNANDAALGVELCYGSNIDKDKAYLNYITLIAYLCKKYKLDPEKHIVGHYKLDPDRRSDPLNAFMAMGGQKTFDIFISDVCNVGDVQPPQPNQPFKKKLKYGDKGPDVILLQKTLRKLNFFYYPWDTGNYLILTKQAVCAFQKSQKIPVNGILDSRTIARLNPMV